MTERERTLRMIGDCMRHQPYRSVYDAFMSDRIGQYIERYVWQSDVGFVRETLNLPWLIVKEDCFPSTSATVDPQEGA